MNKIIKIWALFLVTLNINIFCELRGPLPKEEMQKLLINPNRHRCFTTNLDEIKKNKKRHSYSPQIKEKFIKQFKKRDEIFYAIFYSMNKLKHEFPEMLYTLNDNDDLKTVLSFLKVKKFSKYKFRVFYVGENEDDEIITWESTLSCWEKCCKISI